MSATPKRRGRPPGKNKVSNICHDMNAMGFGSEIDSSRRAADGFNSDEFNDRIFQMTTGNCGALKKIFELIHRMFVDCTLSFSSKGMFFGEPEPNTMSYLMGTIAADKLDVYHYNYDSPEFHVGVVSKDIYKILNNMSRKHTDTVVSIYVQKRNPAHLAFRFQLPDGTVSQVGYGIKDRNVPPRREIDFGRYRLFASIPSKRFCEIIQSFGNPDVPTIGILFVDRTLSLHYTNAKLDVNLTLKENKKMDTIRFADRDPSTPIPVEEDGGCSGCDSGDDTDIDAESVVPSGNGSSSTVLPMYSEAVDVMVLRNFSKFDKMGAYVVLMMTTGLPFGVRVTVDGICEILYFAATDNQSKALSNPVAEDLVRTPEDDD